VRRLVAVATRTERQPAPRGVPKVLVAKSLQPPALTCTALAGRIETLLQVEGASNSR
jgi:hypothetical protein